jgi:hypothetical protein
VPPDEGPLVGVERFRLLENRVRDRELAHIVQRRRHEKAVHTALRQSQFLGRQLAELFDAP